MLYLNAKLNRRHMAQADTFPLHSTKDGDKQDFIVTH